MPPPRGNTAPACALCGQVGDLLGVEGPLLGPDALVPGQREHHVHLNCAVWSAEVYYDPDDPGVRLAAVDVAVRRARRTKCVGCKRPGASLSCQLNETACCKNLHFRCALVSGALFMQSHVFLCPLHRGVTNTGEKLPYHLKLASIVTPVSPAELARPGCTACPAGRFDPSPDSPVGPLLRCAGCGDAVHALCASPPVKPKALADAMALRSALGYYRCAGCTVCGICERLVPPGVDAAATANGGGQAEDSGLVAPPQVVVEEVVDLPNGTHSRPGGGRVAAAAAAPAPVFSDSDDSRIQMCAAAMAAIGAMATSSGSDSEAPTKRAAAAAPTTAGTDAATLVIVDGTQPGATAMDTVATAAATTPTAVVPVAPRTVTIPRGRPRGSDGDVPVVASDVEWICCADCHLPVHPACLAAIGFTDTTGWRCDRCIECFHCAATSSDKWHQDYTMCDSCMARYAGGHFCPKCKVVYPDDDTSTDMICCDDCGAWWHSQCIGMTLVELKYYTEDDKSWYTCPRCRQDRRASVAADKAVAAAATAAVQQAKAAAAAASRRRDAAAARRRRQGPNCPIVS